MDAVIGVIRETAPPAYPACLDSLRSEAGKVRFRSEIAGRDETSDQLGYNMTSASRVSKPDAAQGKLLTDDYNLPNAPAAEPVFWHDTTAAEHSFYPKEGSSDKRGQLNAERALGQTVGALARSMHKPGT